MGSILGKGIELVVKPEFYVTYGSRWRRSGTIHSVVWQLHGGFILGCRTSKITPYGRLEKPHQMAYHFARHVFHHRRKLVLTIEQLLAGLAKLEELQRAINKWLEENNATKLAPNTEQQ